MSSAKRARLCWWVQRPGLGESALKMLEKASRFLLLLLLPPRFSRFTVEIENASSSSDDQAHYSRAHSVLVQHAEKNRKNETAKLKAAEEHTMKRRKRKNHFHEIYFEAAEIFLFYLFGERRWSWFGFQLCSERSRLKSSKWQEKRTKVMVEFFAFVSVLVRCFFKQTNNEIIDGVVEEKNGILRSRRVVSGFGICGGKW